MSETPFPDLGDDVFSSESDGTGETSPLFVVFSYIPILCLAPILKMGEDENLRFHARQGLVLFLIEIIAALFLIPALSTLFWKAILIGCIGSAITGVLFALQGKKYKLPIISDLAEKIKL
jgi:uncharacterized membrane protein